MSSENLTLYELLAPTLFVIGATYFMKSILPVVGSWARYLLFALVWGMVGWYLHWRLTSTVWVASGSAYEVSWIWACFVVEVLALLDQFILYLSLLRTTDRRREADDHEARLRALPAEQIPTVDVFIATYNEPLEVLEKTITGALCLDYPSFKIWVLDDGRRAWLKQFCESKGVGYLTRPDKAHAKAGNINHALTKTEGEFVALFDADFIPQRNFLMRTIGFFDNPAIGILQLPHAFYNPDPMQANLGLTKSLPDEQRFFFDVVMPSRDGWDAAFCCGSNSVTRRAALDMIGGRLPTDSITEDMLLSMTLLRKGYVTRYLGEKLAFGLAPETVKAFFVQRQRWARGAIQILYLKNGPFGVGLSLMQRLLFLPTHWISLSLRSLLAIVAPIVFLWTGLSPVFNVHPLDVLYYFVPMALAISLGISAFAPGQFFPLASMVQSTFLSFKILPSVLETLIRPFGHHFKVTPKGGTSQVAQYASGIFWSAAALIALTITGLLCNAIPEWRIIADPDALTIVAFWSAINCVVLFLVCLIALQAPLRRSEVRLDVAEPIWVVSPSGIIKEGRTVNMSLSGAALELDCQVNFLTEPGQSVRVFIAEVGFVAARVVRQGGRLLAVSFELGRSIERDLLVRKLFTGGLNVGVLGVSGWSSTAAILKSVWEVRTEMPTFVEHTSPDAVVDFPERLPARSHVIPPSPQIVRLSEIGAARRSFAA